MNMAECWLCGKMIDRRSNHIRKCPRVLMLHNCSLFEKPHFVKDGTFCQSKAKQLIDLQQEVWKLKKSLERENRVSEQVLPMLQKMQDIKKVHLELKC